MSKIIEISENVFKYIVLYSNAYEIQSIPLVLSIRLFLFVSIVILFCFTSLQTRIINQ